MRWLISYSSTVWAENKLWEEKKKQKKHELINNQTMPALSQTLKLDRAVEELYRMWRRLSLSAAVWRERKKSDQKEEINQKGAWCEDIWASQLLKGIGGAGAGTGGPPSFVPHKDLTSKKKSTFSQTSASPFVLLMFSVCRAPTLYIFVLHVFYWPDSSLSFFFLSFFILCHFTCCPLITFPSV